MLVSCIIAIVLCLILSGFFSACETAFTFYNKNKMKSLAADGHKTAGLVLKLSDKEDQLFSAILIGNNIVNVILAVVGTFLFSYELDRTVPKAYVLLLAGIAIALLILFFGEITPKAIAKDHPEATAQAFAGLLKFFCVLLFPLNAVFIGWKKLMSKMFKKAEPDTVTEGEVLNLVDEAHETGSIDEYNKELIENIFDFDDLTAGEIATHRTDLIMLSTEDSLDEWDDVIQHSRFSRYPVYGERVDDVMGVLDAKKYFRLEERNHDSVYQNAIRPPYFVPENIKLDVLFRNMKDNKEFFAVVMDEHGGLTGVVTMNDLIECLVGEFDTYETAEEETEPEFVQENDSLWTVLGEALISDVNKKLGLSLNEDEVDTLSGYILGLKGIVPEDGTTFELETDELTIKALQIKDHTVEKAQIFIKPKKEDEEAEEEETKAEKKDSHHSEKESEKEN